MKKKLKLIFIIVLTTILVKFILTFTINEIIILKKGKEVARLISKDTGISFLTDSLTGILKKDYNEKDIRAERIAEKYENID